MPTLPAEQRPVTDIPAAPSDRALAHFQALLEFETLDGKQIKEIIDTGRMPTPPPSNKPPRSEPLPLTRPQGTTIAPDFPPGLTEAPA